MTISTPTSTVSTSTSTKILSVNDINLLRDLPERDHRCGQMVQRHETPCELLVSHQQLAKPIEPTVGHLDDPPSGFLARMLHTLPCLLATPLDVRDVALLLDAAQCRGAGIARIRAQMRAPAYRGPWFCDHPGRQDRLQLRHLMPIGSGHDDR